MSYTELDAWLDEKDLGDWPFNRWGVESFPLRPGHRYFWSYSCSDTIDRIFYRLQYAFGSSEVGRLEHALQGAVETIRCAIEHSEDDAYTTWLNHDVWLSVVDESLTVSDDPVQLLIESIDYVGTPEGVSKIELCAAIGLWAAGEWAFFDKKKNEQGKGWAMAQAAVALAEAEYHRGCLYAEGERESKVSQQNRGAAQKRHASNRENKLRGRDIWLSKAWGVQADAERAIAAACNITKEVAGRWVRQFKRAQR